MSEPFERALRAAARRGRAAGVCPDAELLAALVDGSLAGGERRRIEAHAADCLACQEHLALLGSLSVAPMETPARGSWLTRWGWLVPAAAAVLVIGLWTRMPQPDPAAILSDADSETARPADTPGEPMPSPNAATPAPGDASPLAFRDQDAPRQGASRLEAPQANQQRVGPEPLASRQPVELEPLPSRQREKADDRAVASPPAVRPLRRDALGGAAGQAELDERLQSAEAPATAAPVPEIVQPPAAASKPAAGAGQVAARRPAAGPGQAASKARPPESKKEIAVADAAASAEAGAGQAQTRAGALEVQASGAERYRVRGADIELSEDGGRTWQRIVRLDGSGTVTAAACAGACWFGTSSGRIWIVGRLPAAPDAGEPVGRSSRSVDPPSPGAGAVVAIAPQGPRSASITMASGRRLHTADLGTTWTELPPLPDDPPKP